MTRSNNDTIDINCDLGEGVNALDCAADAKLMPYISRCNIACGGHAGNKLTMNLNIQNAKEHNVKIGAHPGYPDKDNFGRLSLTLNIEELASSLKQQLNQFKFELERNSANFSHIKFHGALYNDIESNSELAFSMVKFCKNYYPTQKLLGLVNGSLSIACSEIGYGFISEAFMDRAYRSNGKLVSRKQKHAVHNDSSIVVEQAVSIATHQLVSTTSGDKIRIVADSICLHGDNPNALAIAKSVYSAMLNVGIRIQ